MTEPTTASSSTPAQSPGQTIGLFDLSGRVALVTGAAAGGLGAEAARVLGQQGASIVVSDIDTRAKDLQVTAHRLKQQGTPVETAVCDVTDEGQVTTTVARVEEGHGGIDILVNAAGIMLRGSITATSRADWDRVMGVNVTGTWLTCRAAAPRMAARGEGKIVNFSTVYAERVGALPESAYYASKAAVANLTRAVAAEFGPQGVQVNCLAPGVFYPTRMTEPLAEAPDTLQWFTDRTLLKRLGRPHRDLDGPLLLLASAASDYMTGQTIYVDGGWSAW